MSTLAWPIGESATAAEIRSGHQRLLATFRDFLEPLTAAIDPPDEEALRAAVAFLRQGLLAFARREEALLAEGERREDAVLEHAFLAGEVGCLAEEVRHLLGANDRVEADVDACLSRMRRLAYRIEAVLELHLLKEEEAPIAVAASPSNGPEVPARKGALTAEELDAFLRRRFWATLCTLGEAGPYAVPVSYALDGSNFVFATGPGRKARNLDASPRVCLTIAEVEGPEEWCSVVAIGEAHPVDSVMERLRALRLLSRSRGVPTAADLLRFAGARVYRFVSVETSGRCQHRAQIDQSRES